MNILLIAYKIEAGKGSEDSIGYNFCKGIARSFRNVTLITRKNNIDHLKNDPEFAHVTLYGVDVPKPWGNFKKGSRGIILYYYLWQIMVGQFVSQLDKEKSFEIIHQITFATTWAPHFIRSKNARIFWGPLINHSNVPFEFWFSGWVRFLYSELLKWVVKGFFWQCDPFLKRAIKRTNTLFLANHDMPDIYQNTLSLSCAASDFPIIANKSPSNSFNILFVGRFVDLKGCMPALESIRIFLSSLSQNDRDKITIDFVGLGPLETKMKEFSQNHKLDVRFTPWVDQKNLSNFYAAASVFLYPSFEGQGLVVAEALAHGCPIVCLDKTGPAELAGAAGITVEAKGYAKTTQNLGHVLGTLFNEYKGKPENYAARMDVARARARALSWENKVNAVIEAYNG